MGLPGLYASFCVLPVYVAGQRRSGPGLMLAVLVLSSHEGTRGGRRSLLFRSDPSSALDVHRIPTKLGSFVHLIEEPRRQKNKKWTDKAYYPIVARLRGRTPLSHLRVRL